MEGGILVTEDAKKERELIAKIQKNNDIFAMKELMRRYRGLIRKCVKDANLGAVMSEADAISYAENQVKHIIKENFDLSRKVQPNTLIVNALTNKLRTLRYQNISQSARMSTDLGMKAGYVTHAVSMLERRGVENPSPQQIVDYVKHEMGRAPKFTKKEAQRILDLSRTELSGDTEINKGVGANASMTLQEAFNTQSVSAKDLLEQKFLQDKIERIIASGNYTRNERIFIRRIYRIGEYANIDPKNIHQAALNSGLADTVARRALTKLEKELKGM